MPGGDAGAELRDEEPAPRLERREEGGVHK